MGLDSWIPRLVDSRYSLLPVVTETTAMSFPSDIEISQAATPKPITEIADAVGIAPEHVIPFGDTKAKIRLDARKPARGKYICVTAITPTPLGEGKTTTVVGLTQALGTLGHKAACSIRQPSMGPTFGIKGGAAGGGYSQVIPMEDFNLHLTGDIHAVSAAHNLASAAIDARMYHEVKMSDAQLEKVGLKRLAINRYEVTWPRVLDVNDRSLRKIVLGLGGRLDGLPREAGFDIAVASELMAILALSKDLKDLRERVGRAVFGVDKSGKPLTLDDLQVAGAATVLLKDALMPNLMQTLEGQPAFVHCGPFANIAHGNSSIVADQVALGLCDYVVTEAGFGADIGMEKFFNLKCRVSGLIPNLVVVVATVRALKMHGGGPKVVPGKPLPEVLRTEHVELLKAGLPNLTRNIEIAKLFGIPVVVAINRFPGDSDREVDIIREAAIEAGALDAVPAAHFEHGGEGAADLARAVAAACDQPSSFKPLYDLDLTIREKIEVLATQVYGASGIDYDSLAKRQIDSYEENGFGGLPICMAKTHLSISHDPTLKGDPRGYLFPIREVRAAVGAGYIYPLAGEMRTMPGLGSKPAYMNVDITDDGRVTGLF